MKKKILIIVGLLIINVLFASAVGEITQAKFYQGWNLVYGFYSPEQLITSPDYDLVKSDIKAVYAFIPTTQEYVRTYPRPEVEKLSVIDDDKLLNTAFWVYSEKRAGGMLEGERNLAQYTLETEVVPLSDRQLYRGWNFVGITDELIGIPLNNLKGDCTWTKVYTYSRDGSEMKWLDLLNNPNFMDQEELPTAVKNGGLLIKVVENCNMRESTFAVPPTLPGE
ncbi:hypothetical protein HYT52_05020 [Candidatus Woesearchaeota archaeon]|nr:hypothetical protein [Candidatus Woesearchaeota archaeon]